MPRGPESRSSPPLQMNEAEFVLYSITKSFPTLYLHHITHTGRPADHQQQPFETKFMMSEKKDCIQKSTKMVYTLISNFEQIFPGNNRVQSCLLHFLTLNKLFGGVPFAVCNNPPSYLHKRVGDHRKWVMLKF